MLNLEPPSAHLARIQKLEDRFPVEGWTLGDVHLWPIIRSALGYSSFSATYGSRIGPPHRIRDRRIIVELLNLFQAVEKTVRDLSHHAALRPEPQVLFLGDGVSKVLLGGRWYDRLCEPFMEILDTLDVRYLLLEPGTRFSIPRNRPSRFVQPILDGGRVVASLRGGRTQSAPPEGFQALLAEIERAGFDPRLIGWDVLVKQVTYVDLMKRYFMRVIRKTQARHGFAVDVNLTSMAFHLACRSIGIGSTEIQHGMQGPDHWAYAGWTKVPAGGYPLLPSSYWVWSEHEGSVIEEWATGTGSHRPIVGGNLWMQKWSAPDSKLMDSFSHQVRQRSAGSRCVLWSMQRTLVNESDEILAAIRASPSDWTWFCRVHPLMSRQEKDRVLEGLRPLGISKENVAWASSVPLPALVKETDVHLTHSSAVVLEAVEWGIPSIVTSPDFATSLPPDVRELVHVATSAPDILAAIGRVQPAKERWVSKATNAPAHVLLKRLIDDGSASRRDR